MTVTVLGLGAVIASTVGATFSPWFEARSIPVAGNHRVSAVRIRDLAGVDATDPTVYVDAALAERALEADPWIIRATVERDLPSTVRITVEEREPVAVVDDGSGRVIGEDGTVLPGAATRGLTEIDEVTGTDLRTAGAVLAAIPPERRTEVARITADVGGTLTLELRSGALVRYGAPEDLVAKGEVLAAVLERLEADGERATRIDVTAPSAPTVT